MIVPPVYAKQALIQTVRPAWIEAREALEESDRVLFFGYSVPALDIEAEKLFQRALREGSLDHVDIVNPDPDCTARYAGLLPEKPLRSGHPGRAKGPVVDPASSRRCDPQLVESSSRSTSNVPVGLNRIDTPTRDRGQVTVRHHWTGVC